MTIDHTPQTPLRRSKRGQPVLAAIGPGGGSGNRSGLVQTHDSDLEHTRKARVEDLCERERDKLDEGDLDIEEFKTRFYKKFERNEITKPSLKVHGKGKRPATATTIETYKLGDTVLVETTREPSVAVITAIWKVVGGEGEEYMNVSLHWFLKPSQLAGVRARREHLENEIYYTLEANTTVPASMILTHCTVSSDLHISADFFCLSAIDARRGLHYEFHWDELHAKALEVPDFWDDRDQWDLNAQDIVNTLARNRIKAPQLSFEDNGNSSDAGSVTRKRPKKNLLFSEKDHDMPTIPLGAKRKRATDVSSPFKKARSNLTKAQKRPASSSDVDNDEEEDGNSDLSDDGDGSDEYTEVKSASESDDELAADYVEDEDAEDEDEHEEEDLEPRTPSRKRRIAHPRTPRTPRTPHTKRSRAFKLAAPTPHSKAALRARASRKRALAVRPPPLVGAHDFSLLENVPQDPWLRAMHVLHVASRPDVLPCREEEYGWILRAVEELLEEGSGGCVFVAGVPGTGKTATVHAVIRELKRMAEQDEGNPFTYVEINGLRIPEPSAAYGLLWEAVSGHDVSKDGHLKISAKESLKQLTKYFSSSERAGPGEHACVVLMDELDQLLTTKQDVVYNFFNWPTLVGSKLVVIAVANTMDLPDRVMTGRVRSRLGMTHIKFQPYTKEQLTKIVNSRLLAAKTGMPEGVPDAIAPDGITLAAMKVSNISGDARRVLDILRRTVETVYPRKKTAQTQDVSQVVREMQNSPTVAFLRELSFHERVMLAAIMLCVRKEGVEEIRWGKVKHQHLALTNLFGADSDMTKRPTSSELLMVLDSLSASRAVLCEDGAGVARKAEDDRRVLLNLDHNEVGRVLGEEGGVKWRAQLSM